MITTPGAVQIQMVNSAPGGGTSNSGHFNDSGSGASSRYLQPHCFWPDVETLPAWLPLRPLDSWMEDAERGGANYLKLSRPADTITSTRPKAGFIRTRCTRAASAPTPSTRWIAITFALTGGFIPTQWRPATSTVTGYQTGLCERREQ